MRIGTAVTSDSPGRAVAWGLSWPLSRPSALHLSMTVWFSTILANNIPHMDWKFLSLRCPVMGDEGEDAAPHLKVVG